MRVLYYLKHCKTERTFLLAKTQQTTSSVYENPWFLFHLFLTSFKVLKNYKYVHEQVQVKEQVVIQFVPGSSLTFCNIIHTSLDSHLSIFEKII
jgi:hypothetical protein